jgi:two-component system cell cycle sensor histidine kinase/response regulator CckA
MERQLLQAHKMEAIGRLAGGIAHDFNNILTVILGYCEMLRDVISGNEEGQGVLREIRGAAKRAAMLTQQLLAFSRQQVVQRRVLDVNVVIRAMETMVKRLIGEHIELVTVLAREHATVRADPHQIEQIVMNLVVNARDAMPEGGTLRIVTSRRSISSIPADASDGAKPGPYVEIAVTDSGVGIPAEILPLIFEPFFTTKKPGEGTGLGLSTVYGIVEQGGGFVSVDSEPGRGACFRVCLPEEREKPVEEEGETDASPACACSGRLLVVEDDPVVRMVTAGMLRGAGYVVDEARDGEEGLALIDRLTEPPDLLITDVIMPRMGGKELAELVAKRYPGVGILFLSGYATGAADGNGDWLKGRLCISKPFSREEILRCVPTVLTRPSAPP